MTLHRKCVREPIRSLFLKSSERPSIARKSAAFIYPGLVFLASLALYVSTMPPSIAVVGYAADTLKFQYIGKVLGTPHFGYPTYMFLNILVSRLPFFNLAYRVNLLSAVLASGTLVVLYFIIHHLVRSRAIAFVCALLFGAGYTFWENSIIAEVYSLNTLFVCAVLLFMLKWGENRRPLFFYLGCFLYALSFGNHLIQITMLPALAYWTLVGDRRILLKKKTYLFIGLFVLLGMAQYGYVLVRSLQVPPQPSVFQYWPYTENFGRTHLEVYAPSIPELFDQASGGGWRERLADYSAERMARERAPFFRDLFLLQFGPVGLLLGLTGIGCAFLRERRRAVFLLLIILVHLGFVMSWGIPGIDVHVIPSYLILTIFVAHNRLLFTLPWFSLHPAAGRLGRASLAVLLAGVVVYLVATRYRRIDQGNNVWLANMVNNVTMQIPDDSLVFTNHVYAAAFWYKLYGEEARPQARITVHPIWKIYREDLEYGLAHYDNVFYFLDEPYWPVLEDMGIECEVLTFSQGYLRDYLAPHEGELVAAYARVDDRDSARNVAQLLNLFPAPGGLALIGTIENGGEIRVLTTARGPLPLSRSTRLEVELPCDIFILPGEDIYVAGLSCSRYRKKNNLALIDPESGDVRSMVYVDWKRSAAVEPAYLLEVRRR